MARTNVLAKLQDDVARGCVPQVAAPSPVVVRWAPGRLDVLGALGAAAGGTLAQMALPAKAAVAVQACAGTKLRVHSDQIRPPIGVADIEFDLQAFYDGAEGKLIDSRLVPGVLAAARVGWAGQLAALLYVLKAFSPPGFAEAARGLSVVIRSDVPMGAGQASSTAVLAAFLLAVSDLRGLKMDLANQALCIQRAEALAAESCGGAAAVASSGVIDAMTCLESAQAPPTTARSVWRFSAQPHRLVGAVPLPAEVRVMALDTGVHSASSREALAELRLAGAMGLRLIETIYKDLGQRHTPLHGYLANTSPLLYRQYFRSLLPKRMRGSDFLRTYGVSPLTGRIGGGEEVIDPAGVYRVRTAVDHLIAENEHAEAFLQAMEELTEEASPHEIEEAERQRTLARAGRLMLASHHSYRLRIELSCRQADWLVDRLMEAGPERGVYGARITGAGGGGTVAALLASTREANDAILEVMKAYKGMTGLQLGIAEAGV